jgi:tetratricopeptide (TPR) repeat protein
MLYKRVLKQVWAITLFVFLLFLTQSKFAISAGRLQIEIWSDKIEYLTREPISVHYKVKNVGDKPVIMIFHALKGYFKIKDQQGREYPNMFSFSYAFISDSLKPNESFEGSEGIDARYGIRQPGEYTCYLETPKWVNTPVTKSNEIKIKVKDPEGEEKKALELYLEAEKLKYGKDEQGRKDLKKRELGFLKYQELVKKYPNSIYAPLSLKAAIGVYFYSRDLAERRKTIPLCSKLIEDYPDFYDFAGTFTDLVHTYEILKDKAGAINTMKELIKKHPNTKISERAEYWLEKIEKWEFE